MGSNNFVINFYIGKKSFISFYKYLILIYFQNSYIFITSMKKKIKKINAGILIIGNEILSGRTQDKEY